MKAPDWTRRKLLRAGVAAFGATAAAKLSIADAIAEGLHHNPRDIVWHPLAIPAVTDASLPYLKCAPALVDMGDSRARRVLAYNGQFP